MNIDVINLHQDFRNDCNPENGHFLGHHIRLFFDLIPTMKTYGRLLKSPIFEETESINYYTGHVTVIENGEHVNYVHNEGHEVIATVELVEQWKKDLIITHGKIPNRFKKQLGYLKQYILPEITEINIKDLDWSIVPPFIDNLTMFKNGTWWGNNSGAHYINGHWQGSGFREIGVDIGLGIRIGMVDDPSIMYFRPNRHKKYKKPEFKITITDEYELVKEYPESYPKGTIVRKTLTGYYIVLEKKIPLTYKNIVDNRISILDKKTVSYAEYWKQTPDFKRQLMLL